jgi:hypothetical protein
VRYFVAIRVGFDGENTIALIYERAASLHRRSSYLLNVLEIAVLTFHRNRERLIVLKDI